MLRIAIAVLFAVASVLVAVHSLVAEGSPVQLKTIAHVIAHPHHHHRLH